MPPTHYGLRASLTVPRSEALPALPLLIDLPSPVELRSAHAVERCDVPWACFARVHQSAVIIAAIHEDELKIHLNEPGASIWLFGSDQSRQTEWIGESGSTFPSRGGVDFMAFLPEQRGGHGEVQIAFTVMAGPPSQPAHEKREACRTTFSFPSVEDVLIEHAEWEWVAYAENLACPLELLRAFASIPWVPLQTAVALNPTTPSGLLAQLSTGYPAFVLDNKALDLVALEDPSLAKFSPLVVSAWRTRLVEEERKKGSGGDEEA